MGIAYVVVDSNLRIGKIIFFRHLKGDKVLVQSAHRVVDMSELELAVKGKILQRSVVYLAKEVYLALCTLVVIVLEIIRHICIVHCPDYIAVVVCTIV